MRVAAVLGAVAVVGVVGCVKWVVRPPPEALVELAGKKASYRPWARAEDLCAQNPVVFQRDLTAMNELLLVYLERTSAGLEGAWGEEQLGILEESTRLLPVPLQVEAESIAAAEQHGCEFEGLAQAKELNALAHKRLAQAPDLLKVGKARRALADWKEAHPAQEAQARAQRCAKPSKQPVLFHACEDEASRLQWQFCDGVRVVASPGNVPTYQPPAPPAPAPAAKRKPARPPKLAAPEVYVGLASRYPAGDVVRAPKIPKLVPTKKDDGAPEPGDGL